MTDQDLLSTRSRAARPASRSTFGAVWLAAHDMDLARRRALDRPIRPTRAEIDLGALQANLLVARGFSPGQAILAVVKANAYGHGAVPVARALEEARVELLGVALVEEGVELRNAGLRAPILVMGGSYEGGYDLLLEHDLTPTLFRHDQLERLEEAATRTGRVVEAHVKVDTGMGRIGILPEELPGFVEALRRSPHVQVAGLLSHLANADEVDATFTRRQLEGFREALAYLRSKGLEPRWRHISNSAGLMSSPQQAMGLDLNLARPGIMLYGYPPAAHFAAPLSPVLSWLTGVTHLKEVEAGTPISYGGMWRAPRRSLIATLPVGYADGYSRIYSGRAEVVVRGKRAPIVGRVCMDMCMADVTAIAGVQCGDEVALLGTMGDASVDARDLARWADTIPYEVLCAIGARVPRQVRAAP